MTDENALLLKFTTVALADTPPDKADAAYVFSETDDNKDSGLAKAAELYSAARVPTICCSGSGPYQPDPKVPEAFSGFEAWSTNLVAMGVPHEHIRGVAISEAKWHTGVEAYEFVGIAEREGWRTLFVVAPAFHLTRCFGNVITFIKQRDLKIKVYAIPGVPLPWHENVLHSQGLVTAPRIQLVDGERERMFKRYGNKYDLLPLKDMLDYLAWRDGFVA